MFKNVKLLKLAVSVVLSFSLLAAPAYATETTEVTTESVSIPFEAELQTAQFSVTVPMKVSFKVNYDGSCDTPTDLVIVNNGTYSIYPSNVKVTSGDASVYRLGHTHATNLRTVNIIDNVSTTDSVYVYDPSFWGLYSPGDIALTNRDHSASCCLAAAKTEVTLLSGTCYSELIIAPGDSLPIEFECSTEKYQLATDENNTTIQPFTVTITFSRYTGQMTSSLS